MVDALKILRKPPDRKVAPDGLCPVCRAELVSGGLGDICPDISSDHTRVLRPSFTAAMVEFLRWKRVRLLPEAERTARRRRARRVFVIGGDGFLLADDQAVNGVAGTPEQEGTVLAIVRFGDTHDGCFRVRRFVPIS